MSTRRQLSRLKYSYWLKIAFLLYSMSILLDFTSALVLNETLLLSYEKRAADFKHHKYSIDELLNSDFEYKVSDDIDMDPCKSGKFKMFSNKKNNHVSFSWCKRILLN